MKTSNIENLRSKVIIAILIACSCLLFVSTVAQAQESDDAIEYEFTFAYEEGETDDERDARLEEEVEEYCDGIDSSYYCEEEITTAVNDAMDEDEGELYASR